MKLIYIAGPYRGNIEENVKQAQLVGDKLAAAGVAFICPHSNGNPHEHIGAPNEYWLTATLEMCRRCDAVMLIDGWQDSKGTLGEIEHAIEMSKPVFTPSQIDICIEWALS